MGVPYQNDFGPELENDRSGQTIILHSPSRLEAKGTPLIRNAIKELKNDGYQFEYIEMVNRKNHEVLDMISKSSFIIDQMYSDSPMAGFATEAASFGKPAIVGGYELDKLKKLLRPEEQAPSYQIKPTMECLKKAIIHLLKDKEYCKNLGQRAKKFVEERWSSKNRSGAFFAYY